MIDYGWLLSEESVSEAGPVHSNREMYGRDLGKFGTYEKILGGARSLDSVLPLGRDC